MYGTGKPSALFDALVRFAKLSLCSMTFVSSPYSTVTTTPNMDSCHVNVGRAVALAINSDQQ